MGLMPLQDDQQTLDWNDSLPYHHVIRTLGVQQFLHTWNQGLSRSEDAFMWGDEVEYIVIRRKDKDGDGNVHGNLVPCSHELLPKLNGQDINFRWHQEYAGYMVEGIPAAPYTFALGDIVGLEANMRARRELLNQVLLDYDKDSGLQALTMPSFPLLGTKDSFEEALFSSTNSQQASRSLFIPDDVISKHIRFPTLTRNIRQRRGKKVDIRVPVYRDTKTTEHLQNVSLFPNITNDMEGCRQSTDYIYMDAMCFGMGCCCLQITLQTPTQQMARCLYDHLLVVAPIMLALSAASPFFKGFLADRDCRWSIISQSVDDRTEEETKVISKSRYASASRYLTDEKEVQDLNDLELLYHAETLETLEKAGVDEAMARHIAHLFIRDPLVIYDHDTRETNRIDGMNHFDNIQSTNWQTVRFKPPIPQQGLGWRVEFRPTEVQLTDTANAALAIFIVLLCRMITDNHYNREILGGRRTCSWLVPISKVDENMRRAEERDAVLDQVFWWKSLDGKVDEMPIDVIVNGGSGYVGLIPLLKNYLNASGNLDSEETRQKLMESVEFVSNRASGRDPTDAKWMRHYVVEHPEYKRDSVVNKEIVFGLLSEIDKRL